MLEEDYVMRIIHEMVRTLLKLLFNMDEKREDIRIADMETDRQYRLLCRLVDSGRMNEAENRLFDEIDPSDINDLQMGLLFFDYLNELSDEVLEEAQYTREEIRLGIEALLKEYGYDGLGGMVSM
ncbi:MAG: hypothetical protein IJ801_10510 [Lachnospiraceae bacterium]|nr:hypothetical protein [Lachnospiraceae bacterium]